MNSKPLSLTCESGMLENTLIALDLLTAMQSDVGPSIK
jgi:hypothetical protein